MALQHWPALIASPAELSPAVTAALMVLVVSISQARRSRHDAIQGRHLTVWPTPLGLGLCLGLTLAASRLGLPGSFVGLGATASFVLVSLLDRQHLTWWHHRRIRPLLFVGAGLLGVGTGILADAVMASSAWLPVGVGLLLLERQQTTRLRASRARERALSDLQGALVAHQAHRQLRELASTAASALASPPRAAPRVTRSRQRSTTVA